MPYVLGIDHVAFAAHDLEATCAQTIGFFVGPCPKLPFIRRRLQGPLKYFPL